MSSQPEAIITVSANSCPHCSWRGKLVIHGVPWCPDFYATARIDTNGAHRHDDGSVTYWAIPSALSRLVEDGELVFVFDEGDGRDAPFGTWARVLRQEPLVEFELVGDRWCYATPPTEGDTKDA